MGPAACQLAQGSLGAAKPGLGLLLAGATGAGVVSLLGAADGAHSVGLQAITAAVEAAMALPGMAITTVLADKASAAGASPIKGATARASTEHLAAVRQSSLGHELLLPQVGSLPSAALSRLCARRSPRGASFRCSARHRWPSSLPKSELFIS